MKISKANYGDSAVIAGTLVYDKLWVINFKALKRWL